MSMKKIQCEINFQSNFQAITYFVRSTFSAIYLIGYVWAVNSKQKESAICIFIENIPSSYYAHALWVSQYMKHIAWLNVIANRRYAKHNEKRHDALVRREKSCCLS